MRRALAGGNTYLFQMLEAVEHNCEQVLRTSICRSVRQRAVCPTSMPALRFGGAWMLCRRQRRSCGRSVPQEVGVTVQHGAGLDMPLVGCFSEGGLAAGPDRLADDCSREGMRSTPAETR
jgi:hypothetical protein